MAWGLHMFCDAGEHAIAAAAYVTQFYENKNATSCLVAAKCRVAPLQAQSIPRQELNAAVLAVRLMQLVTKALDIPVVEITFWTDAQDVLHWLNTKDTRYKPYVATRASEILRNTQAADWRWVPSDHNPADWAA